MQIRTLTKAHIVEEIRNQNGFSKKQAVDTLEMLLEIIKKTLEDEEEVLISGFGKFAIRHKRARRGRNPATGTDLTLKPRKVVSFKCSGKLRERINGF
jgi:integration host factor subunit alpha